MKKLFILDTNVLVHDAKAIYAFREHDVYILHSVIEELDRLKRHVDEVGINAREALRLIDELREKGRGLMSGVRLPAGGMLFVTSAEHIQNALTKQEAEAINVQLNEVHGASNDEFLRLSLILRFLEFKQHEAVEMALSVAAVGAAATASMRPTSPFKINKKGPTSTSTTTTATTTAPTSSINVRSSSSNSDVCADNVILVSKDMSRRIKADALDLKVEDFKRQTVDDVYRGFRRLSINAAAFDELISSTMEENHSIPSALEKHIRTMTDLQMPSLQPNEVVLVFKDQTTKTSVMVDDFAHQTRTADLIVINRLRRRASKDKKAQVPATTDRSIIDESLGYELRIVQRQAKLWNITPRSDSQQLLANVLMNPEISIVTCIGQAGSGKTLLALAAGLAQVFVYRRYESVLVTRPIISVGKEMGALPGDLDNKLAPWMTPVFDNLRVLLPAPSSKPSQALGEIVSRKKGKKKKKVGHTLINNNNNMFSALSSSQRVVGSEGDADGEDEVNDSDDDDGDEDGDFGSLEEDDEDDRHAAAAAAAAAAAHTLAFDSQSIYERLGYSTGGGSGGRGGGGGGSGFNDDTKATRGKSRRAHTAPPTPATAASAAIQRQATTSTTITGESHVENKEKERALSIAQSITYDKAMSSIELEACAYIRGRSLANRFVIVDESQNLSPSEVKTIASRAAQNTKIVFLGDPSQIDSPYLDVRTNGLSYAAVKLSVVSIHAHVTLELSERSELAAIAAKYL